MRFLSICLILIGAGVSIGAMWMDTTVAGNSFGPIAASRVNNIGLLNDKQNYLILGLGILLSGFILYASCRIEAAITKLIEVKLTVADIVAGGPGSGTTPKEPRAPLGDFFEQPEGMPIGVYLDELKHRYNIKVTSNGFSHDGTEVGSLSDLVNLLRSRC